jgi:hypothetical protein
MQRKNGNLPVKIARQKAGSLGQSLDLTRREIRFIGFHPRNSRPFQKRTGNLWPLPNLPHDSFIFAILLQLVFPLFGLIRPKMGETVIPSQAKHPKLICK